MGQLTNYTEKKVLDHCLKTASFSPAGTLYIGLSTADPTHDGSGWTAPTYTGYARKTIAFAAASGRSIANSGVLTFDECTVGSATVTHFGIWDNASEGSGNLLAYGTLNPQKSIAVGNIPSFAVGQISISFNAGVIFTGVSTTILDWLFRGQSLSQPTHVYVGLSTSTPTDGGPNITEPVGNGYAQVEVDAWDAAAGNPEATSNTNIITLGPPTNSWGQCTYGIVWLDTTPFVRAAIAAQTPNNGDTVEWLAGEWDISLQ